MGVAILMKEHGYFGNHPRELNYSEVRPDFEACLDVPRFSAESFACDLVKLNCSEASFPSGLRQRNYAF